LEIILRGDNLEDKMRKCYLYHIKRPGFNLDEGYIGISFNPDRRMKNHERRNENVVLTRAFSKYNDLYMKILMISDRETCCKIEKLLRPTKGFGWNIAPGGDVPPVRVMTEEQLKKLSETTKERNKVDNPMKGVKPWENHLTVKMGKGETWKRLGEVYLWFLKNGRKKRGGSYGACAKHFGEKPTQTWRNMISYCVKFGDPNLDKDWLHFIEK